MEQIVKLLFATTVLSIFSYLLFFSSMGQVGNGGEYWGFDGHVEPRSAATDSFDGGDYHFLSVDLTDELGRRTRSTPGIHACDNHPNGRENIGRFSSTDPVHGIDSVKMATEFAESFNYRMASLIDTELNIECAIVRHW